MVTASGWAVVAERLDRGDVWAAPLAGALVGVALRAFAGVLVGAALRAVAGALVGRAVAGVLVRAAVAGVLVRAAFAGVLVGAAFAGVLVGVALRAFAGGLGPADFRATAFGGVARFVAAVWPVAAFGVAARLAKTALAVFDVRAAGDRLALPVVKWLSRRGQDERSPSFVSSYVAVRHRTRRENTRRPAGRGAA